jgi:hypothetical protein
MSWRQLRGFGVLLYAAGFLLAIGAVADWVAGAWPPRLAVAEWRFAAFGLFSTAVPALVLASVLALVGGWVRGSGTALCTIALMLVVAALVLLVGLVGFGLDLIQVLAQVAPDRREPTLLRAAAAALKSGLGTLALLTGALFGWRGGSVIRQAARATGRRSEPRPLVVGQAE